MEQDELYLNRWGSGTPFFRHAELQRLGYQLLSASMEQTQCTGFYRLKRQGLGVELRIWA